MSFFPPGIVLFPKDSARIVTMIKITHRGGAETLRVGVSVGFWSWLLALGQKLEASS
jgi:hypothetical protein